MGRPMKPYKWSFGKVTVGIVSMGKGRWRISESGETFTQHDEWKAYSYFMSKQKGPEKTVPFFADNLGSNTVAIHSDKSPVIQALENYKLIGLADGKMKESHIWEWVRAEILANPHDAALKLRIPQIAHLESIALPAEPVTVADVVKCYSASNVVFKDRGIEVFTKFMKQIGAANLRDITIEKVIAYRNQIEASKWGWHTKTNHYSVIKAVVSRGTRNGLDAEQLGKALQILKNLRTEEQKPATNPMQLSREEFQKLLTEPKWAVWALLALNCCLHLGEVCHLRWSEFDLDRGVFNSARNKTGIRRSATLWAETVAAMKALPRTGEYVFTSKHGSKYVRTGKASNFKRYMLRLGLNHITFEWLRDSAYTAALQEQTADGKFVETRFAQMLAGHQMPGQMSAYVGITPEAVKPACDAVYRRYFS